MHPESLLFEAFLLRNSQEKAFFIAYNNKKRCYMNFSIWVIPFYFIEIKKNMSKKHKRDDVA